MIGKPIDGSVAVGVGMDKGIKNGAAVGDDLTIGVDSIIIGVEVIFISAKVDVGVYDGWNNGNRLVEVAIANWQAERARADITKETFIFMIGLLEYQ